MIVIVDERRPIVNRYAALFAQEGVSITGLSSGDFKEWMLSVPETDLLAIEAFLLGDCDNPLELSEEIRKRISIPILAISEDHSLKQILELFHLGVDDVLRKPIYVREILARIAAICRRMDTDSYSIKKTLKDGPIRVFNDGRDPEVNGRMLLLPRRERRILEYLVNNRDKRMSKTQIFSAVYGLFNEGVEENVVESHISKLRKKLKNLLGYDVIDSKRFLGYKLVFKD
ncbi:MAG: Flagellar transcriptional regulator FtcR [Candidatus Tokpelaia sp. JSC188]|nr:MAG: Flagellar transcriptional regulator FtcR [Candidatus Tokpelaia sp. JSC188]